MGQTDGGSPYPLPTSSSTPSERVTWLTRLATGPGARTNVRSASTFLTDEEVPPWDVIIAAMARVRTHHRDAKSPSPRSHRRSDRRSSILRAMVIGLTKAKSLDFCRPNPDMPGRFIPSMER